MAMVKYPSLSTEHYSAIIFSLFDGNKTPAQISKICKKSYTTIEQELDVLKEEELIEIVKLDDNNKRKKNEKYIVKLKFTMLCKEFIDYVLSKTNKVKFTKIFYSKLLKNPYLLEILYRSFIDHIESKNKNHRTVNEIFEKVLMQLIYAYTPHDDPDLEDVAKREETLSTFLKFTEMIEDYLVPNIEDTTQHFYDEIREDRVKFTYKTKLTNLE